ncbi:uncharacterized protein LOC131164828 [Malania oleifera]|uniref:uncharacterized protein LOC131164828 n=1 Tax=Malania oleifera TaxID=397392 RepID=UPI0025AE243C|nr:uncharacterized protein LOC131164828 [Malania oleifera]XP_057978304.1 uncharacterized protein LOC131164828 [Malania oleifera]
MKDLRKMGERSRPHRAAQPSIRYRHSQVEGVCFELVDFGQEDCPSSHSDNSKPTSKIPDGKTYEMLSTAELISAVGQLWNCATRPLSVLQSKPHLKVFDHGCQKEAAYCYMNEGNGKTPTSDDRKCPSVDLRTASNYSPKMQQLEYLKATDKMSFFEPGSGHYMYSSFWRFLQGGANKSNEFWKGQGHASIGISYDLESIYKLMNKITFIGLKYPANISKTKNMEIDECCISGDTVSPASSCIAKGQGIDFDADLTKCKDSSAGENEKAMMNTNASVVTSVCSDCFLRANKDTETSDDNPLVTKMDRREEFVLKNKSKMEICSSTQDKPCYALAKQDHAFAGALAGIFVSLCLHPVDTIKTVFQSCHTDQNSISYIGRSIISNRGLTGLYRGITSNIASSAPISALYTFTYESVKGALLPLLPKEYYSVAHCVAGGSASIATSFIFTPSERIKQQMQVGSHYKNCWNALIGILIKGGLPSLYTGWGAVVCRNVPHSIIKFYTYESLKQLTLSSLQPDAQLNTFQTLICGGLAGSTAALFTTPFDVVKTRLQTQIPGSVNQYSGVFHTLQLIGMREGLKGLYRGLTPRLVMYMTQGALFFASYESFKSLFSLKVPQLGAATISHKSKLEDNPESSSLLPSPSSFS